MWENPAIVAAVATLGLAICPECAFLIPIAKAAEMVTAAKSLHGAWQTCGTSDWGGCAANLAGVGFWGAGTKVPGWLREFGEGSGASFTRFAFNLESTLSTEVARSLEGD